MGRPAVETESLTRRFGERVALEGLDLSVEEGCFFGLLGPNGAGKTTTVSILCTLRRPTSGVARLLGFDVQREQASVRKEIGIVFQESCLDGALTGRQNLDLHARLYHLADRRNCVEEELERMGLRGEADRPTRELSGGFRRRLEIARGLLHRPRVLFLDEPTRGLDVPARRALWERLEELHSSRNTTVVLTTHDMEEAARLCDEVTIRDAGRAATTGTPKELCLAVGGDRVELELERPEPAEQALRRLGCVSEVHREGAELRVTVRNAATELVGLIEAVRTFGVRGVRMREASLEDAFLHFTGHGIGPSGELE